MYSTGTIMAPKHLRIALDEIGTKEVSLPHKENPRIIEYHSATTLQSKEDEVPWCSAFVSWCLEQAGIKSTKSAWAKSYLKWSTPLIRPEIGCVMVFDRGGGKGHVTFYVGENSEYYFCLGGNQNDSVCVSMYLKSKAISFRKVGA